MIRSAFEKFTGVAGRLEFVREINGVKIYNDTTATTPDATVAGLRALGEHERKNIVLILVGQTRGSICPRSFLKFQSIAKWRCFCQGRGRRKSDS